MPSQPREPRVVVAAGAVVFGPGRREVLLVHRPKYDDWSFPKGKLDRGERPPVAAVREVLEETGLRVRLGRPLPDQSYPLARGTKTVHYWTARVADGCSDDVAGYAANDEIDQVAWVPVEKARRLLTYPHDRDTLAVARTAAKRTQTLLVLRHSEARSRKGWHSDDRLRPLLVAGHHQAAQLVPLLAAYDVSRVVSSSSARCVQTVAPYAQSAGLVPELIEELTEESAGPRRVRRLVRRIVRALPETGPAVICSHRPVLPKVFQALGEPDPGLQKGELLVLHLRRGAVVARERH